MKNPENLTASQGAYLELLVKSNPMLYRAYLIKEALRLVFHAESYEKASSALDAWMKRAQRCRIHEFLELRKKISRHKDAILQTIKYGLTNARIEAVNNKIKVTIRMGYGYRNIDNLISMALLKCGGYSVKLPGRES